MGEWEGRKEAVALKQATTTMEAVRFAGENPDNAKIANNGYGSFQHCFTSSGSLIPACLPCKVIHWRLSIPPTLGNEASHTNTAIDLDLDCV